MSPKPEYTGATRAEHADTFRQVSVAGSYRFRPQYPSELIDLLVTLAGSKEPWSVLDVGCRPGDLAWPIASLVDRVDAVDISAAMIADGKFRPGGGSGRLNWIYSAVESADVSPPYSLVTGGESVHWMDLSTVFSIFERVLTPGGIVAMAGRRWGTSIDEQMDLIKRSSTYATFGLEIASSSLNPKVYFDDWTARYLAPVSDDQRLLSTSRPGILRRGCHASGWSRRWCMILM